jgi:hypothetical protein
MRERSPLEEYIHHKRELEGLQGWCRILQIGATKEALALRKSSKREDTKVWIGDDGYASVAMVPTVVPTDEILELREVVKEEVAIAQARNAEELTALEEKIAYLSNTDKGRAALVQLQELEASHTELKPQLRVKFK